MKDREDFLFRLVIALSVLVVCLFVVVFMNGCCSTSSVEISTGVEYAKMGQKTLQRC